MYQQHWEAPVPLQLHDISYCQASQPLINALQHVDIRATLSNSATNINDQNVILIPNSPHLQAVQASAASPAGTEFPQKPKNILGQCLYNFLNKDNRLPGSLIAMSFSIRIRTMQGTLTGAKDNLLSSSQGDKYHTTSRSELFIPTPWTTF